MNKEEIKKIRLDNNLTQKQLADELGVTLGAVQKWEYGANRMSKSIENLLRLIYKRP